MVDRPILFSEPMVKALLAGAKTQTRRLATRLGSRKGRRRRWVETPWGACMAGDRLWVREAFATYPANSIPGITHDAGFMYQANIVKGLRATTKFKPSIHMPRAASRLTLVVTEVRFQRLHEISEEDAAAEGVYALNSRTPGLEAKPYFRSLFPATNLFRYLWGLIHGDDAWEKNPVVVAITFTVHQCNIDEMKNA